MYDVVALGELLIDFTPQASPDGKETFFQKNPGGAPANVLAALSRQGKRTAFIGKVGADAFGTFLADVLETNGISTRGMRFSETENTTLAFVELNSEGDRTFTFYRKPGADMMLQESELDNELIADARVFHYGSISMTNEPSRTATLKAIGYAKEQGLLISYDPNLRLPLWPDAAAAKRAILDAMGYADVLKISEEELVFLTGTEDAEAGSAQLREQFGISLICVTMGEKGCFYRAGGITGHVPAFRVKPVDTTGAGDAFMGGVLSQLLDAPAPLAALTREQLDGIIAFGNAMGSLATTRRGAIPAMPSPEEVREQLASSK
ncbi:PfkB family carbohydrate kinase [Paenibacillus gansuensis]|uniref:PfkB family carbohydrate kinase n=1 Tax=Paenibacillus gansuensis TaxID=306542 RepID=A0ABW5PJ76_9BACL